MTSGEIAVTDALSIQGPGSGLLTVDGNKAGRMFNVQGALPYDVTIAGMKLTDANGRRNNVVAYRNTRLDRGQESIVSL